jgi:hypothetical protein
MFIRIIRPDKQQELLLNTAHVWKIEVSYVAPGGWKQSLKGGASDPDAVRAYKVFIGSEVITLPADPDDAVVKVIEGIYRNAVKSDSTDAPPEGDEPTDGPPAR